MPKILHLPKFRKGEDFIEQSPTVAMFVYRFKVVSPVRYAARGVVPNGAILRFLDAKGREWLRIDQFGFLVAKGYAWNGCSPKRWLPVLGWLGTPDFKCTLEGSLLHDALYQFHACKHFPEELTRDDVDKMFRALIDMHGQHEIAATYYAAVREFGAWSHKTEEGERSEIWNHD